MAKPLEGIRVIEIGNLIAGPFAGLLLGDMGADVVKIEKPQGGDYSRAMPPMVNGESTSFGVLNRNKRSLALDLKSPEAREIVLKLAARSDVLLENNRPGALDALGLGAEHLRSVKPDIVYVSVSGFGQTGPYRTRAGVNLTVEAFSGVLSITGEPDQKPMRPGVQTADMFGALFGTYAVLLGTRERATQPGWARRGRIDGRGLALGRGVGNSRLSRDRRSAAETRRSSSAECAVPRFSRRATAGGSRSAARASISSGAS